ncbi:MAG: excinuclease ABC subunit C, partial [Deltaproteobacteria bacterium]|nr:excinuclease ABC subunit C [Deltaproteobacteria bacterium]MBW2535566.1 excinuclease ABC subunit C [Deltaproteobacteria bacterium]
VGAKVKLLALATENAAHAFREKRRLQGDLETRLERMQQKLRLPSLPHVIECCDISHHGGGDAYGSVVCMRDGELDKRRYRTFRVRTTDTGDDYAAMYEVLARRFRRGRDAQEEEAPEESAWELPDLMVVDGGRGQLGVAMAAARDLGLHELAMVGLAKERLTATGDELVDRIYLPGQVNGIAITPRQPGLVLLAQLRDEAHRFANRGRKQAGKRRELRSALTDVRGIGAPTAKALLSALGSVEAVRKAADEQILAVPGVTKRHLRALRAAYGPPR